MERSEIQESASQRKETEPAPPLSVSVSHLYLSSPDSAALHLGYVAFALVPFLFPPFSPLIVLFPSC